MSSPAANEQLRAARLLRWYPKAWRERYGGEFTELLIAELAERPRSWRRTADIACSGVLARLKSAGVTTGVLEPAEQVRASLAVVGCAVGLFLAFAVATWSQLSIAWQWSRPDTPLTAVAMTAMSALLLLFVFLALLAAVPIVWSVLMCARRRQAARLWGPSLAFLVGSVALALGSRHFAQHGWPGTGGHPWAGRGLLSGAIGSFAWAATLSISAYWAHPNALLSFPATEVAWMAASPIAIIAIVAGATMTVRRLEPSRRVLRYEARLASAATTAMIAFLTASCAWIIDGGAGPRNLFHTGAIDVIALVVMATTFAMAHRATRRARSAQSQLPAQR
jgi:hypothetical protein